MKTLKYAWRFLMRSIKSKYSDLLEKLNIDKTQID